MATIQKGQILRQDLNLWDGITKTDSRVGATGGTVTGVKFGESVDILSVYGNGTDYTSGTINTAIGAIASGSNVSFSFATGTWNITENVTVPSNITAIIPTGCIFNISAGITLTFNGDVHQEKQVIHSGSGSVAYAELLVNKTFYITTSAETAAGVTPTYLEYQEGDILRYGAATDGTTDSTTAIDNWIAVGQQGIPLTAGPYTFVYAGTMDLSGVTRLNCAGSDLTIFDITPSAGAEHMIIAPSSNQDNGRYIGFAINGQATAYAAGEYGFQLGSDSASSVYFANNIFSDIYITNVGDHAFYLERNVFGSKFYNIHAHNCWSDGINIADKASARCNRNSFFNPIVRNCKQGIVIGSCITNTFYDPWIEALAGEDRATGKAIDLISAVGAITEVTFINPYIEWNESTDTLLIRLADCIGTAFYGGVYYINKAGTTNSTLSQTSFIHIQSDSGNVVLDNVRFGIDIGTVTNGVLVDGSKSRVTNIHNTSGSSITNLINNSTSNLSKIQDGAFGLVGSWTPGIEFGGASTGITYADRSGTYIDLGSVVLITAYVKLSSKGSATGSATLTGLPFTSGSLPTGGIFISRESDISIGGYVQQATTYVNLFQTDGTTSQDTDFAATSQLRIFGLYPKA